MSKIFVFGDSIVYGKWDSKNGWVERLRSYIDKTYNIPDPTNFQVYNMGIPGDVVEGLEKRISSELLSRLPSAENTNKKNLVILAIGINDSCPNNWMTEKQTPVNEFKESFTYCIDIARDAGCEVVCIGLTPVNEEKAKILHFSDQKVKEYDQYLDAVCLEKSVKKLNLFDELEDENFVELLVDVVHPNDEGHEILFQKILEFLKKEKILEYLTS